MKLKIVSRKAANNHVRLLISYAHKTRHLFATGVCIPPQDYKVGHIDKPVAKTNPNADHYNSQVNLLYHEILSIVSTLRRQDKVPTADLVRHIFYNKEVLDPRRLSTNAPLALLEPSNPTVDDYKDGDAPLFVDSDSIITESNTAKQSTTKKAFAEIYEEFLAEKAFTAATLKLYTPMYLRLTECFPKLDVEKFDGAAWMKFRKHLEREGLAANTVCIRMNKAKAMFKYLKEEAGYKIPIRSFPLPKEEIKKIFLNLTDLQKVIDFKPTSEMLTKTKDLLMFQCHTGLRISDLKRVSKMHFRQVDENHFIQMNAFKTNVPLMVPLNSIALDVLNKYDFKLPEMAEGTYNREIKDLLKRSGVTTRVEWRAYDEKGNKIFKSANVFDEFSNHCCSRTAIKYFFSVGYTPDQVCRIVGKSLDTIMGYYLETASSQDIVVRTEQLGVKPND